MNSSSTTLTIASPIGMTEAWDIDGKRHELADAPQASAGPTGSRTWNFSSARDWAGWLVALRAKQVGRSGYPLGGVWRSVILGA